MLLGKFSLLYLNGQILKTQSDHLVTLLTAKKVLQVVVVVVPGGKWSQIVRAEIAFPVHPLLVNKLDVVVQAESVASNKHTYFYSTPFLPPQCI